MNTAERFRLHRGLLVLTAVTSMCFMLGACGSSDDSSSASEKGPDTAGVSEAKAFAQTAETRPSKIGVTQPVGKPIPSGKTIGYIQCPTPTCVPAYDSFVRGATVLGWKVMEIQSDGSPESLHSAFARAIQAKVDGVTWIGFDSSLFPTELQKLKAAGIPTVGVAIPTVTGPNPDVIIRGEKDTDPQAKAIAAFIVANAGSEANLTYVNLPAYPIYNKVYANFTKYYEQYCATCKVKKVDIPNTAIGKDADQRILGAIRSNPGTNALFSINDGLTLGIPAALKTSGQSDVKVFGYAGTPPNFQYMQQGLEVGTVGSPLQDQGWYAVDAFARSFAGVSTTPSTAPLPVVIWTKNNLPTFDAVPPVVADFEAQFKKLWDK